MTRKFLDSYSWLLCSGTLLLTECSSPPQTNADTSVDATNTTDQQQVIDSPQNDIADVPAMDTASDSPSTTDTIDVTASEDVTDVQQLDSSMVSYGPSQCANNNDCPGTVSTCQPTFPGGVCIGCRQNADDCPSGTTCSEFGVCVRDCTTDADCNAGTRCNSLGQCQARSCPCPAPYVCDQSSSRNQCSRPPCDNNGSCPSPFTCSNGTCVEP